MVQWRNSSSRISLSKMKSNKNLMAEESMKTFLQFFPLSVEKIVLVLPHSEACWPAMLAKPSLGRRSVWVSSLLTPCPGNWWERFWQGGKNGHEQIALFVLDDVATEETTSNPIRKGVGWGGRQQRRMQFMETMDVSGNISELAFPESQPQAHSSIPSLGEH